MGELTQKGPPHQRKYVRGSILDGMSKFIVEEADMS